MSSVLHVTPLTEIYNLSKNNFFTSDTSDFMKEQPDGIGRSVGMTEFWWKFVGPDKFPPKIQKDGYFRW